MTSTQYEVFKSLFKDRFDPNETMKVLKSRINVYWSWGVSSVTSLEEKKECKGLLLRVNGRHHKGFVLITLDFNDTYIVNIINTRGRILNTYTDIYFEHLVQTIDDRIEFVKDYVRS